MLPTIGNSEVATALVRHWCGWHVAPVVTETVTLDTREGASILLPTLRLVGISEAILDGEDILDGLEWSADGMIRHRFKRKFRALTITMEHGFEAADVVPLVDRIASRLTTQKLGVTQYSESTGPYSVSASYGGAGGSGLLAEDREALRPFRLEWGV